MTGIATEPAEAEAIKAAKERRLNVVQIPALRVVGLVLVLVLFITHEAWIRHAPVRGHLGDLAAIYAGYAACSWILLQRFFGRWQPLAVVVLSIDVFFWALAVYWSGGNESWLLILFLVRGIDQANTTVRRVLFFGHLSTLGYIAMVLWIHFVDGRPVDVPAEVAKTLLIYIPNLYILFTVRTAQGLRDRLAATVRLAKEMATKANEANRAKSDFFANVSHEVRTPMNAVVGLSALLLESGLDATQLEHAATLEQSAHSLLAIINDILDVSKLEARRLELRSTDISLRQIVEGTLATVRLDARKRGLALTAVIADDVPTAVRADGNRLRQILLNLVANAVKFTAGGGVTVTVSVVDLSPANVRLRFSVVDTGIGIPPEFRSRLFQPFSQAPGSGTGTGLGLSIAKELVELFGGEIGLAESEKGASFWFTANVARSEAKLEEKEPAPKVVRAGRILLAEDNAINQRVALAMLAALGHRADAVWNGQEAITAALEHDYDLVLMDCQMPGVDGYDATRAIRAKKPALPIIAFSANTVDDYGESGMSDFSPKPFAKRELAAILDKWLPEQAREQGIDRAGLVERLDGNEALADELIALFLEDAAARAAPMREALATGGKLESLAHALKGAAGSVHATHIAKLAAELETAARGGEKARAARLIDDLERAIGSLVRT